MSFAKSHTLASLDDTVTNMNTTGMNCTHERLLDNKKIPVERHRDVSTVVLMGKYSHKAFTAIHIFIVELNHFLIFQTKLKKPR